MKGFVCERCGFVAIDGEAPERCPVCGAPQKSFTEKDVVKTSKDVAVYGESEKKHVPHIRIASQCGLIPGECRDVQVRVGEIQHPMVPEHHIMNIDFYIDKKYISRVYLSPDKLHPAAGLHLKPGKGVLTVIEHCNLHGYWMSEAELE